LWMYIASVSVASPGPPPVIAYGMSNVWIAVIVRKINNSIQLSHIPLPTEVPRHAPTITQSIGILALDARSN